ncbi:DUF333 domain-containing protein [Ruegeria sediminis]|uniref:DUF333 domain-containing protein n=1 Tax=Ruegeria sediminis TaxID=2583820 RepID=A0ABY2WYA1_9RHOB|nr:DUF333 domain-containing protein [Ruegeria sediminis]TMV07842.1 DUF333 domain-containing protein [Ruegeria sediminis]
MKTILCFAVLTVMASAAYAKSAPETKTSMANPAATFCVENDGEYQIRKDADGSEYGVCILPDGQELDAWEFLRSHFEN